MEKLTASRQYDQALTKCRDAMKDSALKPFEADLRLWEQNIQACGRVLERARAGAKGLVGRQSDFEIKKGDKGRMHIPGEVEKFENDALFVRMGGKVMEIPFDQLGPNEVSRLAAEGGSESPRDRLDRAVLLFYEGLENDALKLLREVKDGDAATLASAEAIQKLVEDGAERRKRQAKEQRATELVSKVKADYDAKLWQNVLDGIAQLRKDYSDTESVKKSASDLDEKQKVAAERVKMVVFSRDHKRLTLLLADGVKMEFVLIPPGSFMMGEASASAMPVHRVTITRPFYIGIYEVTQSQWRAVVGKDKSWTKGGGDLPAMNLSWDDCYSFLSRLGERIGGGLTCRLATEAEWEYACRAGSRGAYCFGDDERLLGDYAWYDMNNVTHNAHRPVGTRKPNMWGLYDMHGNVWEWCSDWYGAYSDSPQKDPAGPSSGVARVLRGGHFVATSTSCTSGNRKWMQPQVADYCNGFRVVSTVPSRGDGVWRFLLCRQA
ncbi:MAG: formylglycine-generating enzyme family protein [Planctomycetes bacterium]|nr:formylglycine-generating enzyme family protein [Planctomycetota bacterium]